MTHTITAKKSHNAWLIWGLGALFYFYEYFVQVSPSVMVPALMQAFAANAALIGTLVSVYLYAYSLMQIPVGIILDRFGVRRALTVAALLCGLGCLLFGLAPNIIVAGVGRFLIGLGSAFAAISCMHLAATWFPARRFALLTGLMLTIGMLGAAGGEAPLAILVHWISWRPAMVVLAATAILISGLIYAIVRDKPTSADMTTHQLADANVLAGLYCVLRCPQAWLVAIFAGLVFLPITVFASLWGVPFLAAAYHLPQTEAAHLNALIFIGFAIGAPLFGWFSDHIHRRKLPLLISSLGSTLALIALLYWPHPNLKTAITLLLLCGFFTSAFLPGFSLIRENIPARASATALGFMNTLNMIGGAIGQPIVGRVLDHCWAGQSLAGTRIYTLNAYKVALTALPIGLMLSLLLLPLIKETYCRTVAANI